MTIDVLYVRPGGSGWGPVDVLARLAARLLAELDGPAEAAEALWERFATVLPRRYAAVQEIRTESRDAGTDPDGDAAWARILEVTRG